MEQFLCSSCGQPHEGPPLAWHFEAPDAWRPGPANAENFLTSDQCAIDGKHFFIRGLIEIPLADGSGPFAWGVWVSLSQTNFERASELWEDSDRMNEPPYFGWLCNSIPGYPETTNLKTAVHTRPVGIRPLVELEPTEHLLAIEQREGISQARVRAIAELMYHLIAER